MIDFRGGGKPDTGVYFDCGFAASAKYMMHGLYDVGRPEFLEKE